MVMKQTDNKTLFHIRGESVHADRKCAAGVIWNVCPLSGTSRPDAVSEKKMDISAQKYL